MELQLKLKKRLYLLSILLILTAVACDESVVYDTNITLKPNQWIRTDTLRFDFNIEDENQKYDMILKLRYSKDYKYYNIYIKTHLIDSLKTYRKDSLTNIILFDPKKGNPLGSGSTSMYDIEVPLYKEKMFSKKGKYVLETLHFMRDEYIDGLYYVGIKINKSEEKK